MSNGAILEHAVHLPGRGTTRIREVRGPESAPTLVLLHGLGATGGLNWRFSMLPLGRHYRVIAIDQRDHGGGIQSKGRFRLADCADDVAALADALRLRHIIPVGYSMGGPIAQLVWHRHSSRLDGLVLCATAASFAKPSGRSAARALAPWVQAAARVLPRTRIRAYARRVLEESIPDPDVRRRITSELAGTDPVGVAQAGVALARFSSKTWIGKVDVPTAVVVTELDELIPPDAQIELAATIPGATVHPVNGGHRVCVSRPDLFVPVLLEACRSVTERARLVTAAI